jgi:membrane-bound ClpP family serine protease
VLTEGVKIMEMFLFLTQMSIWSILCFLGGFALVIFEMFVPGFGLPGIIGVILLFLGVVVTADTLIEATVMIILILAFLGVLLSVILHSATKGRLSKTLILNDSLKRESGFSGTEELAYFLGKEGISTTILRPSGTCDFDGVRLDVITQGEFLPRNTKVKIIKVEGRRIVVQKI